MKVSISIIDYIGKVKDGVATLMSINIDDTIYQMIFWFNKDCKYVLSVEEDLLKLLNINVIYEYEHIEELLKKIFMTLPPAKQLFDQFKI